MRNRRIVTPSLSKVGNREKLEPRKAPYWGSCGRYRSIGFVKSTRGVTWIARWYDSTSGKHTQQELKSVQFHPACEQYKVACALAEVFFATMESGGNPQELTVKGACERYLLQLQSNPQKTQAQVQDARDRFHRHVYNHAISNHILRNIKPASLTNWRNDLAVKPTLGKNGSLAGQRSAASINRDMAPLRAALNRAFQDGFSESDRPWKVALKAIPNADKRRNIYIDRSFRRKFLAELGEPLSLLTEVLFKLPVRPKALANARVADYCIQSKTLNITDPDKGHTRVIPVGNHVAKQLEAAAKGKLPAAYLFTRSNGKPWQRFAWRGPVKRAAKAVGLPDQTVMYSVRHTGITDLVSNGLDLFHVAKLAGTSIAMIERHYGHLQADKVCDALDAISNW